MRPGDARKFRERNVRAAKRLKRLIWDWLRGLEANLICCFERGVSSPKRSDRIDQWLLEAARGNIDDKSKTRALRGVRFDRP